MKSRCPEDPKVFWCLELKIKINFVMEDNITYSGFKYACLKFKFKPYYNYMFDKSCLILIKQASASSAAGVIAFARNPLIPPVFQRAELE